MWRFSRLPRVFLFWRLKRSVRIPHLLFSLIRVAAILSTIHVSRVAHCIPWLSHDSIGLWNASVKFIMKMWEKLLAIHQFRTLWDVLRLNFYPPKSSFSCVSISFIFTGGFLEYEKFRIFSHVNSDEGMTSPLESSSIPRKVFFNSPEPI